MVRFRLRTIILILFTAAIGTAIVLAPRFIESAITEKLDLALIKESLAKNIQSRTGMTAKIQGLNFDLWYGFIFTGIRLYPASEKIEKTYLLYAENLILNISYFNLLRGKDPFSGIKIRGGKFNPYSIDYAEWKDLAKNLSRIKSEPAADASMNTDDFAWNKLIHPEKYFYDFSNLPIEAQNIRISLPVRKSGSEGGPSILKLKAKSEMQNNIYTISFSLHEGTSEKLFLAGNGKWSSIGNGEIRLELTEFPLHIMSRILSASNIIPAELEDTPVTLETGDLNGKGSVTFLKNGMGMNMEGETINLQLNIPDEDSPIFSVKGKSNFSFNTGIDTDTGITAFIKFSLKQEFLDVKMEYENPFFKKAPDRKKTIKLTANAKFQKDKNISPVFPFLNADGSMKIKSKINYTLSPFFVEPEGEIIFEDMTFTLPPEIFEGGRQKKNNNLLHLKNWNLSWAKTMTMLMNGTLMDSKISLSLSSPLKISKEMDRIIFTQNWAGNIMAEGLSYQNLADTIFRLHRYVLKEGGRPDAKKAEDHGPIWQFGFMKDPLYVSFIRPMDLNLKLQFSDMKDSANLPDAMQFDIIKRGGSFRFDMKDIHLPEVNLDFFYTAEMELSLPHHELKLNLSFDRNPLSISEAMHIEKPPEKIKISYSFGGDGIYSGDMVSRSWSSLLMEMDSADISQLDASTIASHVRQFNRGTFIADKFSLQRSTEGPFIRLGTISFTTPDITGRGSGQYLLNSGGKMEIFYTMTSENNKSGKFTININDDESMTPELMNR